MTWIIYFTQPKKRGRGPVLFADCFSEQNFELPNLESSYKYKNLIKLDLVWFYRRQFVWFDFVKLNLIWF